MNIQKGFVTRNSGLNSPQIDVHTTFKKLIIRP